MFLPGVPGVPSHCRPYWTISLTLQAQRWVLVLVELDSHLLNACLPAYLLACLWFGLVLRGLWRFTIVLLWYATCWLDWACCWYLPMLRSSSSPSPQAVLLLGASLFAFPPSNLLLNPVCLSCLVCLSVCLSVDSPIPHFSVTHPSLDFLTRRQFPSEPTYSILCDYSELCHQVFIIHHKSFHLPRRNLQPSSPRFTIPPATPKSEPLFCHGRAHQQLEIRFLASIAVLAVAINPCSFLRFGKLVVI